MKIALDYHICRAERLSLGIVPCTKFEEECLLRPSPRIMHKAFAGKDLRVGRGVRRLRVRKVRRQDRQRLLVDVALVDDSDTGRRREPQT